MIRPFHEGRRNLLALTAAVLVNLMILGVAPLLLRPDRTPPAEIEPPVRLRLPAMAEAPASPEPAAPPRPPEMEPPAPEPEPAPPPPEPTPPEVDVPAPPPEPIPAPPSPPMPEPPPPDVPVPTVEAAPPPPIELPASRVPVRVRPRVADAPVPPTAAPSRPEPSSQAATPKRSAPAASQRSAQAPAQRGPLSAGEVDNPPEVANANRPSYPYMARRRGVEGVVRVRFLVDRNGRVQNLEILQADPPGVFEDAVREAIPQWRFRPGRHQGKAVETRVELPIRFELD